MAHRGYNNVVSSNANSQAEKYQFNGKELSEELGLDWHDFGARNYDASLGRWMNIDPLAEDYYSYSTYNYTLNNPIYFVDPDGRGVNDWYKNKSGDIVWFDNDAEQFSNENGDWENIGETEQDVLEHLDIDSNTTFEFQDIEAILFTGVGAGGKRGGLPGAVIFDGGVSVSNSLEISNTDNGELVDGESQVTGINVDVTVGVTTTAPGLKLTGDIGGNFSINKRWTPTGKSPDFKSSEFEKIDTPILYGGLSGGSSGKASLTIPISNYKNVTRNYSRNAGGVKDMSIKIRTAGTLQQNGQKKVFTLNASKKFN